MGNRRLDRATFEDTANVTGDKVVIYMAGGSACLDDGCTIGTPYMRKDGGFAETEVQACADGNCEGTFPSTSIFDRGAASNPFTDATYVDISNCAGDYYVGNGAHAFPSWTAQFHGSQNQALFAAALAASFPSASRIVLTGGSAGSVGALLNYWQWVDAFPSTPVDLVADSFALVFTDGPQWRYGLHAPVAPPACATCTSDYRTVYDFNADRTPGRAPRRHRLRGQHHARFHVELSLHAGPRGSAAAPRRAREHEVLHRERQRAHPREVRAR